jgi:hypothetical protein
MDQLDRDGYILIKGVCDPIEGKECINGQKVDYARMTRYINNNMISSINEFLGWDADYLKYRVSDNNNSADASVLHRDIINQRGSSVPCFTCLTYLDKATTEVIPGTHKKLHMSYSDSLVQFTKKIKLTCSPGDILLFYSTLIHRGIFTENLPHRRLIQVFEVFPSAHELQKNSSKFLHVKGDETHSQTMIKLSMYPIISDFLSTYGYFNCSVGYGNMNLPDIDYFSSEGLRERLDVQPGTLQEINKYIIMNPAPLMPKELVKSFRYICYTRQFMVYTFFLVLTVFLLVWVLLWFRHTISK